MKCCIKGCDSDSHYKNEALSFFSFPKSKDRYKVWVENIGAENIISSKVLGICSKHFEPDAINRTLAMTRLKENAIPTIFPYILTATELSNTMTPQPIKEPKKALTMVIDTGVCKGVVTEHNTTANVNPDVYEVHVHVPRESDSTNTSPRTQAMQPQKITRKRPLSSISTYEDDHMIPSKKNVSQSSLRASKMQHLSKLVEAQKSKIKALMQAQTRLKKKVIIFKNVIDELKKNSELSKEHTILAEESHKYLTKQITKWGKSKKV